MTLTMTHLFFALVAIISFILGRVYGRTSMYEDIISLARWMNDINSYRCMIDYDRIYRFFHWGTVTGPGLRYYGFVIGGFQLGYTRRLTLPRAERTF